MRGEQGILVNQLEEKEATSSNIQGLIFREDRAVAEPDYAADFQAVDEAHIEGEILRERQEDINQIERLMVEVNQMTIDMATEVESADAKLDNIAENARSTKENTKKALVDIAKGADYQKKANKKM